MLLKDRKKDLKLKGFMSFNLYTYGLEPICYNPLTFVVNMKDII